MPLYSKKKLSRMEQIKLYHCKEDYVYTCGGTIFPDSHDLFSVCCPELLESCEELVSPHYYSCRLKCELCCYNCGVFGDLRPISDELKRSFQSVHPVCTECFSHGKKERTRGPKFARKKRTATEASI